MKNFLQRSDELKNDLLAIRRHIHENAECGDELPMTVRYVTEQLENLGLHPQEICKSGLTALIQGGAPGKTILLRADMDALPMPETNDLPFCSKTGCAHTCGHDMHTAMLLGAAKMLLERKESLRGKVKLMFQPAEEIFTGSLAMIQAGVLESPKVDASLALHVMTEFPVGTLVCRSGAVTSSCDGFKITITGKGCHGAKPQNGIDPINVGVHLHLALQSLIARECPPDKVAVLTIGQFAAGTTANLIPENAVMQGTMRTYDSDLRTRLFRRVKEVVALTAETFGAKAHMEILSDVPSIDVNPDMMESCIRYLGGLEHDFTCVRDYLVTPSEDYAHISRLVPSAFFSVGARPQDPAQAYPNHNPKVIFDEDCLPVGAALIAQCAFEWLHENS